MDTKYELGDFDDSISGQADNFTRCATIETLKYSKGCSRILKNILHAIETEVVG